jgi:hypothetical protein
VKAGLLALVVCETETGKLRAKAGQDEISVDASDADSAVKSVQALLERTGIMSGETDGGGI